jgi:hypothetical protein
MIVPGAAHFLDAREQSQRIDRAGLSSEGRAWKIQPNGKIYILPASKDVASTPCGAESRIDAR